MAQTNEIRDLYERFDDAENNLIFEKNVSIPLRTSDLPVRCNVYRPATGNEIQKFPILITYGPYGKDIPYSNFFLNSFNEVNPEHRSTYSAWETPDPVYWTGNGYIVVRVDERGLGQSPGLLDTMSQGTSECFFEVIEWAADQPWSSGKVGLLGISYYAGTQWRVAARRPKGLAAIIPWEGMADYYRDRCRHGGILSNNFIFFWWNRQVLVNQYGKPGRSKLVFPKDGPGARGQEDTAEGDLPVDVLEKNRRDQTVDNEINRFRDDEYYASKDFNLEDIEVPLLSVANWGGILLHLRGNVEGYKHAGSKQKWIRFITGRHDLPFYYHDEVEVQKSFLNAFLKGEDNYGWTIPGNVPPVTITLRKGNVGFNNSEAENAFIRREEEAWPIPRTQYTKYHLVPGDGDSGHSLTHEPFFGEIGRTKITYKALGSLNDPQFVQFSTPRFEEETEITGHVIARLSLSMSSDSPATSEGHDIDVFVTLRYIGPDGQEVYYTGTAGDPVPLTKGWLRASMRKVKSDHPKNQPYQPYREYLSTDVQEVVEGNIYTMDIEIWPTNVVVEKGGRIVFEVASGDTQGCGVFQHTSSNDRPKEKFAGENHINFGKELENYVVLPIIPPK